MYCKEVFYEYIFLQVIDFHMNSSVVSMGIGNFIPYGT